MLENGKSTHNRDAWGLFIPTKSYLPVYLTNMVMFMNIILPIFLSYILVLGVSQAVSSQVQLLTYSNLDYNISIRYPGVIGHLQK